MGASRLVTAPDQIRRKWRLAQYLLQLRDTVYKMRYLPEGDRNMQEHVAIGITHWVYQAGTVKINRSTIGNLINAPFGGLKRSSTSTFRESGRTGLEFYTQIKTVYHGC